MKLSWLIAECTNAQCFYRYDVRAPKAADLFLAASEGKLVCIKCGEKVKLCYPDPTDLMLALRRGEG